MKGKKIDVLISQDDIKCSLTFSGNVTRKVSDEIIKDGLFRAYLEVRDYEKLKKEKERKLKKLFEVKH